MNCRFPPVLRQIVDIKRLQVLVHELVRESVTPPAPGGGGTALPTYNCSYFFCESSFHMYTGKRMRKTGGTRPYVRGELGTGET